MDVEKDKISFLIKLNQLKNSIMNQGDFDDHARALCRGIIDIFGMERVVFYRPLENGFLHALYEFVRSNGEIIIFEGDDVHSSFNPSRKISENERMYLADRNGYYIKLKDSINDEEKPFILISIKDKEGRPRGYLKIEKETGDQGYEKDLNRIENISLTEKNELFLNRQRELLSELQEVTERITEVASFITLSTVKNPYCELNEDRYTQEKFRSLEELILKMKSRDAQERFTFIPHVIRLLDAESIVLYAKSSHNIVKTIGLWSKESEIPSPVYQSSFLQERKLITNGDSMYFADSKGYDIVLDVSSNPKCLNMKELSNITSYIIVPLKDTMKKTIGFLKVNYLFRGDIIHFKAHSKLKKDLEMLKSIVPHLTAIPENEEFTHNPLIVLKNLCRLIPDLPTLTNDHDLIFHYMSDILIVDPRAIPGESIPELIDTLKKYSYFVKDKKLVIHFFKWLYNALDNKDKALILSAITAIFEHLTIEQGMNLSAFRDDCFDTLSTWMKSEIQYLVKGRHAIAYSVEMLDQLLQLNCVFISKYHHKDIQRCTGYLEALNLYDLDNTDLLFTLFEVNPNMSGS